MRHLKASLVIGTLILGTAGCTIVLPDTPATPAAAASPTAVVKKTSVFIGDWDTTYGVLTLTASGDRITGSYGKTGKIDGTLSTDGTSLQATWTENGTSGPVTFRVSDDGNQITGIWSENGVSGKKKDWTGNRLQAATPA